jgi:hypothetical protein
MELAEGDRGLAGCVRILATKTNLVSNAIKVHRPYRQTHLQYCHWLFDLGYTSGRC